MLTIDVHAHMLPQTWPDFSERFGYGRDRFIWPEPGHDEGIAVVGVDIEQLNC